MKTAFDKKLSRVSLRCHGNLLLESFARVLLIAAGVAALGVLAQRLLGMEVIRPETVCGLAGAVVLAGLTWWFLRRPSRMEVALLVDHRLRLKERFSTALAMAGSNDPFACAASQEAHDRAKELDLHRRFPVRPTRGWLWALAGWTVVVAMAILIPTVDALGFLRSKEDQQRKAQELAQARTQVTQAAVQIQSTVKQLGDAKLSKEMEKLADIKNPSSADEARRQAIKKLGDLSERVKDLQKNQNLQQTSWLKDTLQQVKTFSQGQSRQLNLEIAQGKFEQAAQTVKELQKQLDNEKLTPQQKEALAKQLQDLGKQLDDLAKNDKQLQGELAQAGADKSLAKKGMGELKDALKKQGLSDEQIKQLLAKAAASKAANAACQKLAKACNNAGANGKRVSASDLKDLEGQLSDLEGLAQQLELTQASLEEIQAAIEGLGQGGQCAGAGICPGCPKCKGNGGSGTGEWAAGAVQGQGSGTGGPGQGQGARPTGPDASVKTLKTRVENPSSKGPIIASWYIKGDQVKGQATKELGDVVKAKKDAAAQAITDNQIPKKYEGPIMDYYGRYQKPSGPPK